MLELSKEECSEIMHVKNMSGKEYRTWTKISLFLHKLHVTTFCFKTQKWIIYNNKQIVIFLMISLKAVPDVSKMAQNVQKIHKNSATPGPRKRAYSTTNPPAISWFFAVFGCSTRLVCYAHIFTDEIIFSFFPSLMVVARLFVMIDSLNIPNSLK